jgi:uncharacterized protein YcgL (UPF0745 family)
MKLVEVFKSSKKPETYLYVERGAQFAELPDGLQTVFGDPQPVLSLKLTPERQLARYTGAEVLEAIEKQGFFLQLPPQNLSSDEREQAEHPSC